jgi:sigma-E factor negative regulatory protein RseA
MLEKPMAEQHPRESVDLWQALSSLADGEADADEQGRCLGQWGNRSDLRERWHQYQVIGDVMRSAELARGANGDAAFLQSFRDRLALEPPRHEQPESRTRTAMPRWMAPLAMAAGVAAVALTLNSLWPASTTQRVELASTTSPLLPASAVVSSAQPPLKMVNGQLIRDARLDRYLAAHRQGANGAALQMPGAVVRSVDTIVLDDK